MREREKLNEKLLGWKVAGFCPGSHPSSVTGLALRSVRAGEVGPPHPAQAVRAGVVGGRAPRQDSRSEDRESDLVERREGILRRLC